MYKKIIIIYFLTQYCIEQFKIEKSNYRTFKTVYWWNRTEFDFDGIKYSKDTAKKFDPDAIYFKDDLREEDMFFIQHNNVPLGFDVYRGKLFLTIPRKRYGVPSTLNFVAHQRVTFSPLLKPYPNVDSVSSFVSVYRPKVDVCDRLWMVDTGLLEIPDNHMQVKPPEIIIFDLKTDTEILRHQLSSSVLSNGTTSGLTSIIVDVTKSTCDDAYAYINDLATGGLIVFSLRERDAWRFTHPTFSYESGDANFTFVAKRLQSPKAGIFSIALSDPDDKGVRTAYYHALTTTQEYSITTDILKNRTADFDKNYKLVGDREDRHQTGSHAYHSATRTVLFASETQSAIICWNVDKPLTNDNISSPAIHIKYLSYVSDLKIVDNNVVLLINHLPRFAYTSPMEANFMLWAKVADLINGTNCMQQSSSN